MNHNAYRSWAAEGDEEDEEEVTASVITDTQASSVIAGNQYGNYRRADDKDDAENDYEEGLPEELPEYACSYCGYHDPNAAVQCNICQRWFCNGKGNMNGSHIVLHLLESKHNEVSPTENSVMGSGVISCFLCGINNIFVLGLVPLKNDDGNADTIAVPLCRDTCRHQPHVEYDWDPEAWLPLIDGRQLQSNIVAAPSPKEMRRCRTNILQAHIKQLEECWKNGNDITMDVVVNGDLPVEVRNTVAKFEDVPNIFKDGKNYYEKWMPLVKDECQEAEAVAMTIKINDVTLEWEKQGSKVIGTFTTFAEGMRMRGGSLLELTLPKRPDYALTAVVLSNKINNTVGVVIKIELEKEHDIPTETKGYTIGLIFMPVPYKRMEKALQTFFKDSTSVSNYLYKAILGHTQPPKEFEDIRAKLPNHISVPGLAPLNESQERAVRESLLKPLTLIQGPPGTGKTTTTASIVYFMSTMWKGQVLVAAPSNVAANELAERISRTKLVVLRVLAKSQEDVPNSIEKLCLHKQLEEFIQCLPPSHPLPKLFKLFKEIGTLRHKEEDLLNSLIRKAEEDIICAADVVVVTCSAAASTKLEKFRFQYIIIDEIAQSCEPEAIVPIVTGAKQLVLVGDHCQLGPVCRSRAAEKAGLSRSLFERLFRLGAGTTRLDIQYRMHPFLSVFSSDAFYDGTLQNGVRPEERDSSTLFPWPNPDKPMIFYNSIAPEELGSSGTSNLNRYEAALAEKFLTILVKNGVRPASVGIVTPYEAQRAYLVNYLVRSGALGPTAYQDVEVSSVDGFQGREKDFIIMSCVRSNENYAIGFLKDWRRLNVALTRARFGVIIIGNARVLGRHPLWHSFLTHCKVNGLVVEGPPQAVYPIDITLPKPHLSVEAMNTNNVMSVGQEGGGAHRNMYAVSAATEDGMSTIGESIVDEVYVPGHQGNK